jgi:hypothetical protein
MITCAGYSRRARSHHNGNSIHAAYRDVRFAIFADVTVSMMILGVPFEHVNRSVDKDFE